MLENAKALAHKEDEKLSLSDHDIQAIVDAVVERLTLKLTDLLDEKKPAASSTKKPAKGDD